MHGSQCCQCQDYGNYTRDCPKMMALTSLILTGDDSYIIAGQINGIATENILLDSGFLHTTIRKELAPSSTFTVDHLQMVAFNGKIRTSPLAEADLTI